jgi:hypothetical protein
MAQEYSRQGFISILQSLLPTNGQELIKAIDIQEVCLALLYSTYNKTDDSINNNFTTSPWNNTLPYAIGFIVEYQNKFWKSKIANNTNIVPVEGANWTEVSKAEAGQNINLANFFTKLELQTAGQSSVNWDNITQKPTIPTGEVSTGNKIIWVSKAGNDSTAIKGRLDKTFLTIQNAVNQASSGDTIIVLAGNYSESVSISGRQQLSFLAIGEVNVTSILGGGNPTQPIIKEINGFNLVTLGLWRVAGTIGFTTIKNCEITNLLETNPSTQTSVKAYNSNIQNWNIPIFEFYHCKLKLYTGVATKAFLSNCIWENAGNYLWYWFSNNPFKIKLQNCILSCDTTMFFLRDVGGYAGAKLDMTDCTINMLASPHLLEFYFNQNLICIAKNILSNKDIFANYASNTDLKQFQNTADIGVMNISEYLI